MEVNLSEEPESNKDANKHPAARPLSERQTILRVYLSNSRVEWKTQSVEWAKAHGVRYKDDDFATHLLQLHKKHCDECSIEDQVEDSLYVGPAKHSIFNEMAAKPAPVKPLFKRSNRPVFKGAVKLTIKPKPALNPTILAVESIITEMQHPPEPIDINPDDPDDLQTLTEMNLTETTNSSDPQDNSSDSLSKPTETEDSNKDTTEGELTCHNCSREFPDLKRLETHIRVYRSSNCRKAAEKLNKSNSLTKFRCTQCGQSFIKKHIYDAHIRQHSNQVPFICDVCGKGYKSWTCLYQHKRLHTDFDEFKCKQCQKNFGSRHLLASHMKVHSTLVPLLCDICGRGFKHRNALKNHVLVHNNDKPFICEICSKAFRSLQYLNSHKLAHEDNEGKPFKCDQCGKGFTAKHHMTRHLIIHTQAKPYSCEICFKSFNQKHNVKIHMKSHRRIEDKQSSSTIVEKQQQPEHNPTMQPVVQMQEHNIQYTAPAPTYEYSYYQYLGN